MISSPRGVANSSRISASSSLMTPRSSAVVGEDRLELGDRLAQLGHLLLELGAAEPGEPRRACMSRMCSACTSLNSNGAAMSAVAGRGRVVADARISGDDLVDHVERLEQALDDVGPRRGPCRGGTRERRVMTSTWWSM